MVTPDRRRRAVEVLVERFGVSERRACRVVGQHRSTQRRDPRPIPPEDAKLRARLRRFARNHPRMGWRKAHVVVRREGYCVNHKKLRRLCASSRGHRIGWRVSVRASSVQDSLLVVPDTK